MCEASEDWQSGRSLVETNMYMFDNELGTDITLVMGDAGSRIPAHKFMLSSRSQVFYAMFYGQLAETGNDVIIPDIDYGVMKHFIRYLYGEEINIKPDCVMALMYTAKKYNVQTLIDKCRTYLQTELSSSNVCTIMEQAHLFDEKQLWEQCLVTIFSNSTEVITCEFLDYQSLCRDCLGSIVKDDKLVAKEELIFLACRNWAEERCRTKNLPVDDGNIRHELGDLLYLIRFPNMDERMFTDLVSSGDLLTAEEKLAVYQHFNRSPRDGDWTKDGKPKFPSKSRTSAQEFKIERFGEQVGGTFDFWINDNLFDAISFKCSRSVHLIGVLVFSPFSDGIIRGHLRLFDETNTCIAKKDRIEILHSPKSRIFHVKLRKAVRLEENRWYTVRQQMTGAKSFFGKKGQREIIGKGVIFSFRNSPMDTNNTNVESGQIYGLIYA